MSDLLDGATVPWYFVSGTHEPGTPAPLPDPVRREPTVPEYMAAAAALDTAEAANWRVLAKVRAMSAVQQWWTR